MKEFEHFPDIKKCPICKTNDDKPCVLLPVDNTEIEKDSRTVEAVVVHTECLHDGNFRYNRDAGVIYKVASEAVE
jgi:hypothetical protein